MRSNLARHLVDSDKAYEPEMLRLDYRWTIRQLRVSVIEKFRSSRKKSAIFEGGLWKVGGLKVELTDCFGSRGIENDSMAAEAV